jgi:hypothetical protein
MLRVAVAITSLFVTVAAHAGLFGPGKFEVKQVDSRFSENKNPTWTSENNRISKKSIAGGMHIDGSGVFVNPAVTKDAESGKVVWLALAIVNRTSYDTAYGSPNTLGDPQEISFLVNEAAPIVISIQKGDTRMADTSSYNSVSKSASRDIMESGIAVLTPDQYQQIVDAKTLAVKITGSKRSVVYEVKDIAKTFVPNLRSFFDSYVLR